MDTSLIFPIWNQITTYMIGLDWGYILTFTVIAFGLTHLKVKRNGIKTINRKRSCTRYRIAITGLLYGIVLYYIRGYTLEKVECLLQSYVFALVFHELIIEGIMRFLGKRVLPKRLSKRLIGEDSWNQPRNNENGQL